MQAGAMSLHSPPEWHHFTVPVSTQFGSFGAQSEHVCPHVFPAQGTYGPASWASPASFGSSPLPESTPASVFSSLFGLFGIGFVPSLVPSEPGSSPIVTREPQPMTT